MTAGATWDRESQPSIEHGADSYSGTVNPCLANTSCPSGPRRYSTSFQAESSCPDPAMTAAG